MKCPECGNPREHIIRSADAFFLPEEMRPGGLFAWVLRCWECGRNESGYTTLRFRDVTMDDIDLLYNWRLDPETQAQSFMDGPSNLPVHFAWMSTMLSPPIAKGILWLLATIAETPVGVIRAHLFNYPPEVHITVAPEWRGCGIGRAMLALAPIPQGTTGRVKGENIASRTAFEQAGWKTREVIFVNG